MRSLHEGADASLRLTELGLEELPLLIAAKRGFLAWASSTRNHPPLFGSYVAWGETVAAIGESLIPLGWCRMNEQNLPLTINTKGEIAIAVSTGDEFTGRRDGMPSTKSSKGPRTANAVAVNQWQQATLFDSLEPAPLPQNLEAVKDRTTWVLLVHRDMGAREIRCELSRPINMGTDGRVDKWDERILLSATPFDDVVSIVVAPGGDGPQGPEIVVEIKKRATN